MARSFAVSYDYRCPFARNAHESVIAGLLEGRDWDVTFSPFSLDQVHVEEGEAPVWERDPADWGGGVNALLWSIAVRDKFPEKFLEFHGATFAARHDEGRQIPKPDVLREIGNEVGLDTDAVESEIATGRPLDELAQTHMWSVKEHAMFGVPTFIVGNRAVFIRFMDRKNPSDIDRALDLLEWADLNEFKETKIAR